MLSEDARRDTAKPLLADTNDIFRHLTSTSRSTRLYPASINPINDGVDVVCVVYPSLDEICSALLRCISAANEYTTFNETKSDVGIDAAKITKRKRQP